MWPSQLRDTNCEVKGTTDARSLLILKAQCLMDQREFPTYSTVPVEYVAFHIDGKLFSHLDETFLKKGHVNRVVKSTLWQAVSPKHKRILTLDLHYRRHCKTQDNNFPAVTNMVYNAALECILDIFWAGKQRPRVRDKLAYFRWTPPNFDCRQR